MSNVRPSPDQSSAGDNLEPLDHCPACRYSLRGLPTKYRCPECGLEYDDHTRGWHVQRSNTAIRLASIFGLVSAAIFIDVIHTSSLSLAKRLVAELVIGAAALWGTFLLWNFKPFIAITPHGVMFRWLRKSKTVAWPLIERAGDYDANVILKKSNAVPEDYSQYFSNRSDHAEFRRAVNDGIARYNPPAKSESQAHAAADTIESSTTSTERSHTDAG